MKFKLENFIKERTPLPNNQIHYLRSDSEYAKIVTTWPSYVPQWKLAIGTNYDRTPVMPAIHRNTWKCSKGSGSTSKPETVTWNDQDPV